VARIWRLAPHDWGEIVGFVERDWNYQVDGYP
jgi:hypothetical protein